LDINYIYFRNIEKIKNKIFVFYFLKGNKKSDGILKNILVLVEMESSK